MRLSPVWLLLLASPFAASRAAGDCHHPPTRLGDIEAALASMGIGAAHAEIGLGTGPVDKATTGTLDLRAGIALCRWPSLTFGIAASGPLFHPTAYIPPGLTSEPDLDAVATGIDIVKRWGSRQPVHLLAGAIVGQIRAQYEYFRSPKTFLGLAYSGPDDPPPERIVDGSSASWFATPELGIELNLKERTRAYLVVGHRVTGPLATPGMGSRALAGPVASLLVAFGQF